MFSTLIAETVVVPAPQGFWDSVASGIISGIFATVVMGIFVTFFRSSLLPWYQELVYRGISIAGTWKLDCGISPGDGVEFSQEEELVLHQSAHDILGTLTARPRNGAAGETRIFSVKGRLADRMLHLTMEYKDTTRIGRTVYLGQVMKDGRQLDGVAAYCDVDQDKILSIPACYQRA